MILHTFFPETVKFWNERGFTETKRYTLQDFTAWEFDLPDDHPDLKSPEYIGLQVKEIVTVLPEVVLRRLKPPIYTLKIGKFFADISDTKKRGVPLTHNRSILEQMCMMKGKPDAPKIVKLNTQARIHDVMIKAQRQGTDTILFFALPHVCEKIPIESALRVLKHL